MSSAYGARPRWSPQRPRFRLGQVVLAWLLGGISLLVATKLVPGASDSTFGAALVVAAILGRPQRDPAAASGRGAAPVHGAARLLRRAGARRRDAAARGSLQRRFQDRLVLGGPRRRARGGRGRSRALGRVRDERRRRLLAAGGATDRAALERPGRDRPPRCSSSSRSTGSRCRCCSGPCATVTRPTMARWLAEGSHLLAEWEPDLSSQTGASQAGILLGSNDDIPAFRWVEKERKVLVACSSPEDCAELERRHSTGHGLLANGGASRGNLFSGDADHMILTVSRMEAERSANPGYRAFLANGFNVARTFVLFGWEVILEWSAAARERRRDVRPRGHRGGVYPFLQSDDVRDRARPDRLRRPHRHDEGAACDLRDVRELRRGRAPLRPRARGHARGTAQARPAVRPDRARAPLRSAAVRDRRPFRPRPDAGRDVSAAQRLRPRRSRRAQSRRRRRQHDRGRRRAGVDGRPRRRRGDGPEGEAEEERRLGPGRRRARLGQSRPRLSHGGGGTDDARAALGAASRPAAGP